MSSEDEMIHKRTVERMLEESILKKSELEECVNCIDKVLATPTFSVGYIVEVKKSPQECEHSTRYGGGYLCMYQAGVRAWLKSKGD